MDRIGDQVERALIFGGKVGEEILFRFNLGFTVVSGVAVLLGLGLGADMLTGSHVTGIQPPTWDQLKDWVHNNLANNPPNE